MIKSAEIQRPTHSATGAACSGEEEFLRVFDIYGHGGQLGHVTNIMSLNLNSLVPKSLHTKFGSKRPSGF